MNYTIPFLLLTVAFLATMVALLAQTFAFLSMKKDIRGLDHLVDKSMGLIEQLSLASIAASSSKDVNPMTGPAILQQLNKVRTNPQPQEQKPEVKKTGITVNHTFARTK